MGENPLGYEKESKLLRELAIPCIISMLVSALYNIVDQFFIGRGIGITGNAATNIAFPLSTICTALSLLIGIGGASRFSLNLGAGEKEEAERYAGNALVMMGIAGIFLMIITQLFLQPMLVFFGAKGEVLTYAASYTRIVSLGFPFLIANRSAFFFKDYEGIQQKTCPQKRTGHFLCYSRRSVTSHFRALASRITMSNCALFKSLLFLS